MKENTPDFKPVPVPNPFEFGAHAQTFLSEIKDEYINLRNPENNLEYDLKEEFTLSDGGRIMLSFKIQADPESVCETTGLPNDMLFLMTGVFGND